VVGRSIGKALREFRRTTEEVRSTFEASLDDAVLAKLGDKHWMFEGANAKRIDVIKMCADCRVEAVMNESFDPHSAPQRPPVMTTEDYLRARDAKKDDPLGS